MKTKRILSIALTLAISLSLFSGCNKTAETGSDEWIESEIEIIVDDGQNGENNNSNSSDNNSQSSSGGEASQNTQSGSSQSSQSGISNNSQTAQSGNSQTSQQGSNASTDNKVRDLGGRTITYLTYWSEPVKGKTDRETNYWKVKTEIEKKYNCKFKHVTASGDDWFNNVLTSIISGKPTCDIVSSKEIAFSAMSSGLFYDLSTLDEINLNDDKWRDAVTEVGTLNGKKYLMEAGKFLTADLILYNKDLFAAKNQEDLYTLQKNGKLTLDKLISVMKNMYDGKKASTVVDIYAFNLHVQMGYANGGKLVTRKAGTTQFTNTINTAPIINGFKSAQELINAGIVEMTNSDWQWARNQFMAGNYPIMIGGGDLEEIASESDFDLGVCAFPTKDGGIVSTISDIQWAAIPYNVKKADDVALVWNEMVDVIFDVNYKSRYQDIVSSDVMEFINARSKAQVNNGLQVDYYNVIDIWDDGVGAVFNQMVSGEVTPANAIETVSPLINNKLNSLKK